MWCAAGCGMTSCDVYRWCVLMVWCAAVWWCASSSCGVQWSCSLLTWSGGANAGLERTTCTRLSSTLFTLVQCG